VRIDIRGAIVSNNSKWFYDWLEMECTCPKDVVTLLNQAKEDEEIEVYINSGGGDVYSGADIYTALKAHKGTTKGVIVGIAASAASVLSMGVDFLSMSPAAQFMIHKAKTYGGGNHKDMEHVADVLKSHDEAICNAYILKTGKPKKEILDLMDKETYFTAQKAKEMGFVDEILFDEELQLTACTNDLMIPDALINKLKEKIKALDPPDEPQEPKDSADGGAFLLPENGEGEPQPTSDKLQEQQDYLNKLKLKLQGGLL
jgi:ATP-dependent Clp protease protease subunit